MFRKEAKLSTNWTGEAILLKGINPIIILFFSIIFISALILFIIVFSYTHRMMVVGEISSSPRPTWIYSNFTGIISERFVQEGDSIKKGASIYKIDVSKKNNIGIVSDNRKRTILIQINKINEINENLKENYDRNTRIIQNKLKQYQESIKFLSLEIKNNKITINEFKNNMINYKSYQKKGLINKDQLISQILNYNQQQSTLTNLIQQENQYKLQVTDLNGELVSNKLKLDNELNNNELKIFDLNKEPINNSSEQSIIIRSPINGVVDSLSINHGQMISVRDSLVQIIPNDISDYYLVLWVSNKIIPYIKKGDPVYIKYDAFPAEKFGQFKGTIFDISHIPATINEMNSYQSSPKLGSTNDRAIF
ncbi:HlyD family secretion protein (plasmid) [Photobacterium damselae subsp. damselae]|uniref:Microcin H47 secretion protein mchE n=1 Tax=Photobacterium damselae subsp. damselae TaxID=85581 RepID=E4WL54_PHODD|nr:HlyD family secretion protein [Photobacterium damselae]QSH59551.1 HlyD family secretion protein [Photobacterium damselae subsp. damselae]CBX86772.1 Microcin H47 secretion protein mchE [Photobacterium damselae subsp. damselae]